MYFVVLTTNSNNDDDNVIAIKDTDTLNKDGSCDDQHVGGPLNMEVIECVDNMRETMEGSCDDEHVGGPLNTEVTEYVDKTRANIDDDGDSLDMNDTHLGEVKFIGKRDLMELQEPAKEPCANNMDANNIELTNNQTHVDTQNKLCDNSRDDDDEHVCNEDIPSSSNDTNNSELNIIHSSVERKISQGDKDTAIMSADVDDTGGIKLISVSPIESSCCSNASDQISQDTRIAGNNIDAAASEGREKIPS